VFAWTESSVDVLQVRTAIGRFGSSSDR
jgi:hypothetical protein